jgi:hypothetical protein
MSARLAQLWQWCRKGLLFVTTHSKNITMLSNMMLSTHADSCSLPEINAPGEIKGGPLNRAGDGSTSSPSRTGSEIGVEEVLLGRNLTMSSQALLYFVCQFEIHLMRKLKFILHYMRPCVTKRRGSYGSSMLLHTKQNRRCRIRKRETIGRGKGERTAEVGTRKGLQGADN